MNPVDDLVARSRIMENRITMGHLVLFLVFLPFDRIYTELVLISLLAHTLIHLNQSRVRNIFSSQTIIISSVFLLNMVCLAWSPDKKEGIDYLLRQLAILLFPVIFAAGNIDLEKNRKLLLQVFGFTCVIVLLYLYADALRIIFYYGLPVKSLFTQAFINHNFSAPIGLHATYLSLYAALSAVVFLHLLINEDRRKWQLVYTISLLILFAGLIQLSSRAVLLSFMFVLAVVFPFFIPAGKKRVRFILVVLGCSLLALVGIIKADSLKKRYVADLKTDLTQNSINNEMIESRLTRWKAIVPLVWQAPATGHGTGAEKRLLMETYFEKKLYNSYLNELNSHNQYLKFLLETGFAGLLFFLLTIGLGIVIATRNRDIIFLSFMIIFTIVCFSENILDVNKGIFFYAFFLSFFIYGSKPGTVKLRLKKEYKQQ